MTRESGSTHTDNIFSIKEGEILLPRGAGFAVQARHFRVENVGRWQISVRQSEGIYVLRKMMIKKDTSNESMSQRLEKVLNCIEESK